MHETETITEQQDSRFTEYKARLNNILQAQEARLVRLRERAVGHLAFYNERYGEDDPQNHTKAFGGVLIAEQAIQKTKDKLRLARPRYDSDVMYRKRVVTELAPAMAEIIPKGLPLRFHGTPIYNVPSILKDGGLMSSVDRLGAETSYDVSDQVSVTTVDTLSTTLNSYTGLLDEDYMLPAGCVFVLLPASQSEAQAGSSMLMGNVNFTEHPEQLLGILTSNENIDNVRKMSAEAGIDPSKVYEFFDFTTELRGINQKIQNRDMQLQQLVPYELDS